MSRSRRALGAGGVAALVAAAATPPEIEAALEGTEYRYADGAAYSSVGGYPTSFDEATGRADVVAAVARPKG